jgi:hypothetical protein
VQNHTPEHDEDQASPRETSIALKRAEAYRHNNYIDRFAKWERGCRSENAILNQSDKFFFFPTVRVHRRSGCTQIAMGSLAWTGDAFFPLTPCNLFCEAA